MVIDRWLFGIFIEVKYDELAKSRLTGENRCPENF